ncbi:MAG: hypothetical protein ACLRZH_01290 [Ruthenibacterium lactatiformans]
MRDALSAAGAAAAGRAVRKDGPAAAQGMAATKLELAGFSRQLAGRQFQLK